jgi:hypothetical protein
MVKIKDISISGSEPKTSPAKPNTCRYADPGSGVRSQEVTQFAYCKKHKHLMPEPARGFHSSRAWEFRGKSGRSRKSKND